MNPVTALWIIAVPLIDMVAIIYRRLRKGKVHLDQIALQYIT